MIREIRERLGWGQEKMAQELGFSRAQTVSDWERGKSTPSRKSLERIAGLAGRSYAEVFGSIEAEIDRRRFHERVEATRPSEEDLAEASREADAFREYEEARRLGESDGYGVTKDDGVAKLSEAETSEGGTILRLLWRRLDSIDRDEALTPTARLLKREQELAAYRQVIQEREARAAEGRSRAIEKEAENANGRAQRIAEEQPGVETTIMAARKIRELSEAEWRKYQTQLREHQK